MPVIEFEPEEEGSGNAGDQRWYLGEDTTLFRDIVEHSADAIVAIDAQQRIVMFNPAASSLFGYPPERILGADISGLLPERLRALHGQAIESFREEPAPSRYMGDRGGHIVGRRADGSEFPADISILKSRGGDAGVAVAIIRDLTERYRLEQRLKTLADTDPLTGSLNRRAFSALARERCRDARRNGTPLSILVLDLDRFKAINDQHGHAVGDEVIKEFADRLAAALRAADRMGRWGGEEFVALLDSADLSGARAIAERLRRQVCQEPVTVPETGRAIPFTVSIGVAEFIPDADHLDTLINRADTALYRAKVDGRNRVRVAPPPAGFGTP